MRNPDSEILLVDDSPMDVELTVYALKPLHISASIRVAEDGKEALDYVFCEGKYKDRKFANRPALILLDLKLPKVDGLQVLETIRNDGRTRAIPIVILTSSKEQKDVIEGYRRGASAFIQKPVDFDLYCKTIGEIGAFWMSANEPPPPEAFSPEAFNLGAWGDARRGI
jgi:two-component system, response regulator